MIRRATCLAAVLALCAPVTAAFGQGAPFAPLPPAQTTPDVTVAPSNASSNGDDGLKTWQEILIFGGGLALLAGIGMIIVRDARQAAPVKAGGPETSSGGSRRSREKARDRSRAKAKAARQQRRRNR
jgi:hypothetical protein